MPYHKITPAKKTALSRRPNCQILGTGAKPHLLPLAPKSIPRSLRQRPQWVVWKLEQRNGKWSKTPYSAATKQLARVNDSDTWSDFSTVSAAYKAGGFDGIGFVFTTRDPFVGIDLDNCRHPNTGKISPWAKAIIKTLDTYSEVSPSGTGVKLYAKGSLPINGTGKRIPHQDGEVEVYQDGRFFAVTGHKLPSSSASVGKRDGRVRNLWDRLFRGQERAASSNGQPTPALSPAVSDDELLRKAGVARNGKKFKRLWEGDTSDYGGDDSAADLALCSQLAFWTGPNSEQIDRLFRQSGLMRPKWDKKHYSNGDTYGEHTITTAIAGQTTFYKWPSLRSSSPILLSMADIAPQPIEWLWEGRIPLGKLTIVCGDPSRGKSLATIDFAARVSTGREFPGCSEASIPASEVLLLSAEDDPADTIRPRLDAAGADVSKVRLLEGIATKDAGRPKAFDLEHDLPALEGVLNQHPDIRLVILDPVTAYLGGIDSHRNADVRSLLGPLATLAQRRRVAIVAVTHLNKAGGGKAMYRTTGSLAFVAGPRAAWIVTSDRDDPSRRLFLSLKNNLARVTTGLAYRVIDENGIPKIEWESEPVTITADEAMADEESSASKRPIDKAKDWLKEFLRGGSQPASKVKAEAKRRECSTGTLRNAANELKIRSLKKGFGKGTHWVWKLPY